eukprot:gene33545-44918_t
MIDVDKEESDAKPQIGSLVAPFRFGIVNPGITRGAYPTLRNFRLHLKTVISLTIERPIEDLEKFIASIGARSIHCPVSRTIAHNDPALLPALIPCLNVCLDPSQHPIFIHCLDGRKITGLLVLLIRRVQGWTPFAALSEYWRHQLAFRGPVLA